MTVNGHCKLLSAWITQSLLFWRGEAMGEVEGKRGRWPGMDVRSFKALLSSGISQIIKICFNLECEDMVSK